jgi:heme-degrading monooxygenase HmoA
MICRIWHGWTAHTNADAYDSYLKSELFPQVKRELGTHGYRGFHLLRIDRGAEVEFMTLMWFESMEAVESFAGANCEKPVISEKARKLLSHFENRCEHYVLSSFSWPPAEGQKGGRG